MTSLPLETRAKVRDEKGDRLLPHPIRRRNRLTARNENPHRDQAMNRKTRKTRVKFHAETNSVKIRHVDSGILPPVWSTSLKEVVYIATNAISDTCWGRRKAQQEVEERWREKISCDIEGVYTIGLCILRFLSEKICSTWTWKIGNKTRRQILQRHLAPNQNSGQEGSIARYYPKVCASAVLARQDLDARTMRPQSSVGLGETYVQAQEFGQNYVLYFWWSQRDAGTYHFEETRRARIRRLRCTWWAKKN